LLHPAKIAALSRTEFIPFFVQNGMNSVLRRLKSRRVQDNHRCPSFHGPRYRSAFTLVELLVATMLMIILATMALMIIPSLTQGQQTPRAAGQLQQWIEIAKQMAVRDRAPRGIRLLPGEANALGQVIPNHVTRLQYIEQPDPFTLNGVYGPLAKSSWGADLSGMVNPSEARVVVPPGIIVSFTSPTRQMGNPQVPGITLTGGFPVGDPRCPVQSGDYIELGGVVYAIRSVADTQLTLQTAVPMPINTTNYRILRQPRPSPGDELLDMAQNIIIDVAPRGIAGGRWDLLPPGGLLSAQVPLDIMFAPDGRVIPTAGGYNLAAKDKIILWVRDATVPDGENDPTLIVIYPRTGLVAAQPVDVTYITTSPYTFTTTGQSSSD